MPEFTYTARQTSGDALQGTLTAGSRQEALRTLISRSLVPVEVAAISEKKGKRQRISGRHLAAMYSHLADLLHAGVPLLKSLEILEEQAAHPALSQVLVDVRDRVADGTPLAAAMRAHPRVFKELAVSIVSAGEEGGFLEDSLKRVATFTEQQEDLKSRVWGAVAYPIFLTVAGTAIFAAMLVFFIPRFMPIFERLAQRGELPLPTIVLLGLSNFMRDQGWWFVGAAIVAGWLGWKWLASESGRRQIDKWVLKSRGVGPIVRNLAIARFCRVLATLLRNGVPILVSLRIAKDATGNRLLSDAVGKAAENISAGRSLAAPLKASGQFPPEIIELVAIGEQTNRLEEILGEAADNIERRTHRRLDLFVRLLEPVLLLIMAVVILFVLLALLLPVFQSAGSLT